MPRQTYKEFALKFIYSKVIATFRVYCTLPSCSAERKRLEERIEFLVYMYRGFALKRYIAKRLYRQRPMNKFSIDLSCTIHQNPELPWLNEVEFLNAYQLTKSAFWRIVHAIVDHPCFSQKRGRSQQPVAHQVMILLHYLGTAGSDASNHRARNHFHIGYGSVSK